MYVYRVTFLGGSSATVRANSPREAMAWAEDKYKLEAIHVIDARRVNRFMR